jgi:hypothetical protein
MPAYHDRQDTDPFPLRRVVRQRPLTAAEVDAIYGPSHEPVWEPARERFYSDEAVEVPMQRSRWGLVVVALVLGGALALLGYALATRSDGLARAFGIGEPETVFITAQPILSQPAIDVSHFARVALAVPAEPNRGPGIEAEEPEPPARAQPQRRSSPQRRAPSPPPPAPVPAPAETPYPSLDAPSEEPAPEQPDMAEPEASPDWDALPEPQAPAPSPDDDIVRDPGF